MVKEELRPDDRGRIPIGLGVAANHQYRMLMNDAGQILLDPVVTVPARELWLFRNERALRSLIRGVQDVRAGRLQNLGMFAQHIDGEDEKPPARRRKVAARR